MKVATFLTILPALAGASPARQDKRTAGDLFTVIASTRVAAGFNTNAFTAADERIWLPDTPTPKTSCPAGADCPDVNVTVYVDPSTLDSAVGGQELYVDPTGPLRFLPPGADRSYAPEGSLFGNFVYTKNPNSPLIGNYRIVEDDGTPRGFAACLNTTANAFATWQIYVSVPGFHPTVEMDCIGIDTFAGVYTGESPAAYEYV
ncbi:hypothetical protein F5884DRAFT_760248 [Xylogone sp. PMI_703]|nr:hypothetical protein F5884DRAFT_760248 [Xylogone sp. PMI_703]